MYLILLKKDVFDGFFTDNKSNFEAKMVYKT